MFIRITFTPLKIIVNQTTAYGMSTNYLRNILASRFHKDGLPQQLKISSLSIFQQEKVVKKDLSRIFTQLQITRAKVTNKKINILKNLAQRQQFATTLEQYKNIYSQLIDLINNNYKNDCLIYKIMGWYNMQNLFRINFNILFEINNFKEFQAFLESFNMIEYQKDNFYQVVEDKYIKKNISHFYDKINKQFIDILEIRHLKTIQNVLSSHLTKSKQLFYESYSRLLFNKLQNKYGKLSINVSNVIWLFGQYIKSMNDNAYFVRHFQNLIIKHMDRIINEDNDVLIELYMLKGKINPIIYRKCIRPYLLKYKLSSLRDLSTALKFIVCSQANDDQLLSSIYCLIFQEEKKNRIDSSMEVYIIHLYTHYLKIKGYQFNFGQQFLDKLDKDCKSKSQKSGSVSHLIIQNTQNQKYVSNCLKTNLLHVKQLRVSKKSFYESNFESKLLKLRFKQGCKIYKKPHFCCFQLDYMLINRQANKYVNLQVQGIQYRFVSGLLIRQKQIRYEILQHYGIEVKQIKYDQNTQRSQLTEDQKKIINQFIFLSQLTQEDKQSNSRQFWECISIAFKHQCLFGLVLKNVALDISFVDQISNYAYAFIDILISTLQLHSFLNCLNFNLVAVQHAQSFHKVSPQDYSDSVHQQVNASFEPQLLILKIQLLVGFEVTSNYGV